MAYRQDLFLETLRQLRSGRTQEELSEALNELVQCCRSTGKSGEIVLKIKINPDKGDSGQYFLNDEINIKKPKFERGRTIMYGTPEGNLQRTDPNQHELPLRSVDPEVKEVKQLSQPQPTTKTL